MPVMVSLLRDFYRMQLFIIELIEDIHYSDMLYIITSITFQKQ